MRDRENCTDLPCWLKGWFREEVKTWALVASAALAFFLLRAIVRGLF